MFLKKFFDKAFTAAYWIDEMTQGFAQRMFSLGENNQTVN